MNTVSRSMRRIILLTALSVVMSGCSWMTFGLFDGDGDAPKRVKAKGPKVGQLVRRLPKLETA